MTLSGVPQMITTRFILCSVVDPARYQIESRYLDANPAVAAAAVPHWTPGANAPTVEGRGSEGDVMSIKDCIANIKKMADTTEHGDCVPGEPLGFEPEAIEWEYAAGPASTCAIANGDILTAILDVWGKDGWELVQILPTDRVLHRAIFKRRRRIEPEQGKCCECGDQESEGAVITEMWRPPEACCVDRLTLVVWHFENFRFLIKVIPETQQLMARIEKFDELGDVEASIVGPLPPEIKLERSKCCERAGQESEGEQCSVDVHS